MLYSPSPPMWSNEGWLLPTWSSRSWRTTRFPQARSPSGYPVSARRPALLRPQGGVRTLDPSYVHEAHLRTSLSSPRRGRESWLGAAFEVAGPLNKPAFRQAALNWIDRHEAMRSSASIDESTGEMSRVTAAEGPSTSGRSSRSGAPSRVRSSSICNTLFDEFTLTAHLARVRLRHSRAARRVAPDHRVLRRGPLDHRRSVDGPGRPRDRGPVRGGTRRPAGRSVSRPAVTSISVPPNASDMQSSSILTTQSRIWRDFLVEGDGEMPAFPLDIGDSEPGRCAAGWFVRVGARPRPGRLVLGALPQDRTQPVRRTARSSGHHRCRARRRHPFPHGDSGPHPRRTPVGVCARMVRRTVPYLVRHRQCGFRSASVSRSRSSAEVKKTKPIARVPLDRVVHHSRLRRPPTVRRLVHGCAVRARR